jgi:hypothetical protein
VQTPGHRVIISLQTKKNGGANIFYNNNSNDDDPTRLMSQVIRYRNRHKGTQDHNLQGQEQDCPFRAAPNCLCWRLVGLPTQVRTSCSGIIFLCVVPRSVFWEVLGVFDVKEGVC